MFKLTHTNTHFQLFNILTSKPACTAVDINQRNWQLCCQHLCARVCVCVSLCFSPHLWLEPVLQPLLLLLLPASLT